MSARSVEKKRLPAKELIEMIGILFAPFNRPLSKLRFFRFSGSFEPILDPGCRGNINIRILPLQRASKSGQNNPKNQRTLSFERGLMEE